MKIEEYYYSCSKEYLESIDPSIYIEIAQTIEKLLKRDTQEETNKDLFWLLTKQYWSYDSLPSGIEAKPGSELNLAEQNLKSIVARNKRELCMTTTTLRAKWHADFAKVFNNKLVQLEAQFGKVESMFKDFCGFRIAHYEKRLSLGIEIVMSEPIAYFAKHKSAITGMAYFNIAKETLPAIGLDCPIFLIGIRD